MIRFEVTGETPEEFAQNAMSAWGLLAIGLQQALSVRAPTTETSGSESSSIASKEIISTTTNPAKVHSDPVDDLWKATSLENQPTASSAPSTSTTSAKSGQKTKGPKLDDLKTRLSEVIVAATERWDQKRANAYARKLLHEWRAPKLSDLAPDQYEIFMRVSESYLDGTAPE